MSKRPRLPIQDTDKCVSPLRRHVCALRQYPIATMHSLLVDIRPSNIQRTALASLAHIRLTVLGMDATHPHRQSGRRQCQPVAHRNVARIDRASDHEPRTWDREAAINRKPKIARIRTCGNRLRLVF